MKPGMSSLPETAMSYGALCQVWDEVASSLIESMTKQMKSVVESQEFWTSN